MTSTGWSRASVIPGDLTWLLSLPFVPPLAFSFSSSIFFFLSRVLLLLLLLIILPRSPPLLSHLRSFARCSCCLWSFSTRSSSVLSCSVLSFPPASRERVYPGTTGPVPQSPTHCRAKRLPSVPKSYAAGMATPPSSRDGTLLVPPVTCCFSGPSPTSLSLSPSLSRRADRSSFFGYACWAHTPAKNTAELRNVTAFRAEEFNTCLGHESSLRIRAIELVSLSADLRSDRTLTRSLPRFIFETSFSCSFLSFSFLRNFLRTIDPSQLCFETLQLSD